MMPAFVSQSVCHVGELCKMAELVDVLFGMETPVDPRDIVLDGGPIPCGKRFAVPSVKLLWPLVAIILMF